MTAQVCIWPGSACQHLCLRGEGGPQAQAGAPSPGSGPQIQGQLPCHSLNSGSWAPHGLMLPGAGRPARGEGEAVAVAASVRSVRAPPLFCGPCRAPLGPEEAGRLAAERARAPVVPFGVDLCNWGQEQLAAGKVLK